MDDILRFKRLVKRKRLDPELEELLKEDSEHLGFAWVILDPNRELHPATRSHQYNTNPWYNCSAAHLGSCESTVAKEEMIACGRVSCFLSSDTSSFSPLYLLQS